MAKTKSQDFRCGTCGKVHAGLANDYAFRLPDEVFSLSSTERYLRTRMIASFCTIDESRFFIRGILSLPFTDQEGEFRWGVWAEVAEDDHNTCLAYDSADADGSSEPRFGGKLAHAIPGYHRTLGLPVEVQVGGVGQRPTLWLPSRSRHTLAREQAAGISAARHHQMLEACGFFERPA
jgi:hypothetical protein